MLNKFLIIMCFSFVSMQVSATETSIIEKEIISQIDLDQESEMIPKTYCTTPIIAQPFQNAIVKTIAEVQANGYWIKLVDGSWWSPSFGPGMKELASQWKAGDQVVISYSSNIIFPNYVLHNITRELSIYSRGFWFAPRSDSSETVTVKSVDLNTRSFVTNQGTQIQIADGYLEFLSCFCEGDVILLMPPQSGELDGSKVSVNNLRLSSSSLFWDLIFSDWTQTEIE